ncbi:MAG TPA: cohesin domain-containing protein, partial [Chitinophagaceae bacterium]|nr:cohesin domain-containing protein [Chitinophagaceae bacterium]
MKTVNKKKVFSQTKNKLFLTCSVLIVFACVGSYLTFMSRAASNGFYLSPAAATVTVGNNITIQVGLNYGSPVDTVQTYISYQSSLEVVGLPTVSEPYESDYENNTTTPGLIKIQRADFSDAPPIGDRIISTITFKAKSAGAATVAFTDNTYGVNSGTQLSIPLNNANYTLVGPSLPPPPSGSTTPPAPPSSSTNNSSAPKPSGRAASPKQSSTSAPANSSSAPPTTAPSGEPAAENTSEPPGSAAEENTTSSSETQGKTASTGTSEP